MAQVEVPVEIRRLETMTVEITVTREFKIRTWLAIQLMRLAVRVLGAKTEVERVEP